MATLYVRNVPDDLYERLRRQAEGNARSIGAEALQLLDEQLGAGPRRGRRRRRVLNPDSPMVAAVRLVVGSAEQEARALGHGYIGTEHLLLGVLAQRALPGLTLEQARRDAERLAGRGAGTPDGEIPLSARAKKALDLAVREAYPGTVEAEHIALGILREGEGIGFQLMSAAAPDVRSARAALYDALEAAPFHVIELEGGAAEWETQLNDAAAAGYELVSITDRRAVLRL
jgi:hypothetical protein